MSERKKRRLYQPEQMAIAIQAVRDGMSRKSAAKIYGVPRTTLLDKLAGRVPEGSVRPGTKPTLTTSEEKTLVQYITLMAEIGYPLTRKELLLEVKKVLDLDGRKTVFNNNLPGKDWYSSFLKRNPEVSMRTPASLGHERAIISKDMVETWFATLKNFIKNEIKDENLVKDPRRIFNADESGFPLCVKSGKVLAATGSKHVYHVVANSKTQITVMACFNAIGDYMPPMLVYPGQRLRGVVLSGFPEAIFGQTDSGWMDSDLFLAFLEHFLQFVIEKSIQRPVLLFVDGHATHMTLKAAEFCSNNNIILYCLLPNATHIMQACDIGLFSPMKSAWIAEVKNWQMQHIGEVLTKKSFPEVFQKVWLKITTLENSVHAFKKSGLFPLAPGAIDLTKLGPSKIIKKDETVTETSGNSPTGKSVPETSGNSPTGKSVPQTSGNSPTGKTVTETSGNSPGKTVTETSGNSPTGKTVTETSGNSPGKTVTETSGNSPTGKTVTETSGNSPGKTVTETSGNSPTGKTVTETSGNSPTGSNVSKVESERFTITIQAEIHSPPRSNEQEKENMNHEENINENINQDRERENTYTNANSSFSPHSSPLSDAANRHNCNYVSPAFEKVLKVPEIPSRKKQTNIRNKLPKALSGSLALKLLREREAKKKELEQQKQKRKEEREKKKIEREEEKLRKKRERENKKRERENKKKERENKKKEMCQRKSKKKLPESDTDSDISVPYNDTSDESMVEDVEDDDFCTFCGSSESREGDPWVGCDSCDLWYHQNCTTDPVLKLLTRKQIPEYKFVCQLCK